MARQFRHLRAQYYNEEPARARELEAYHLREREIAGLIATETRHPPQFRIPNHSHDLHSFYLVLEGGLSEYSGRNEWQLDTCAVVYTPAGHIHNNGFHARGGRCFLVELTQLWAERLQHVSLDAVGPIQSQSGELARLGIGL